VLFVGFFEKKPYKSYFGMIGFQDSYNAEPLAHCLPRLFHRGTPLK